MTQPIVFISYNRKDEKEKEALLTHLGGLQRAGLIRAWSDDQIRAGADWEQVIDEAMTQAKVAILLITANFLNSEFITEKEVPPLLARRAKGELIIFPVIARACAWKNFDWLRRIEVRPEDGRPVWSGDASHVDEALAAIAEDIAGIVAPPGEIEPTTSPPESPHIIIEPLDIELTVEQEAVLRYLYSAEDTIAIKTKFGSGFSGSHVFRVDLKDRLPEVVKIAPVDLIKKERQAYKDLVKNKLYSAARIQPSPDLGVGGRLDVLRYDLAGGGIFKMQSLRDYYRAASKEELLQVLNRLFTDLAKHWWRDNQLKTLFRMKTDYDPLLPVNLQIKPFDSPPKDAAALPALTPEKLSKVNPGDQIQLKRFKVTKLDHRQKRVTIEIWPQGLPEETYRLRLVEVSNIEAYRVGDQAGPIYGEVKATRRDLWLGLVKDALGDEVDLTEEWLSMRPDLRLRNPLMVVTDYLNKTDSVRTSTIHGDLNLENILVDRENGEVRLIDFATVRQGHVLHDLLRLETQILIKLIPETLEAADSETIHGFFLKLHGATFGAGKRATPSGLQKSFAMLVAIREEAKPYFERGDWKEYYRGLVLYLLSALKFKELDDLSRQIAFWGAATLVDLLNKPYEPPREYAYDVFISYSHADRGWVRGELLSRLEESGLKVIIDYRDFELGRPKLVNMERAVDNSRHTLVVLTPAWIESAWAEFESLLVGTTDPAGRERRLVPLMLFPCQPPARIAMHDYADFTDPTAREEEMVRLLHALDAESA